MDRFLSPPPPRQRARRLSNQSATKDDVSTGGPSVVVPPRMMREPLSRGRTFPERMSIARSELNSKNLEAQVDGTSDSPERPKSPITPEDTPTADTFAFAFDIDGVLIRGGKPIPEAIQAMQILNGQNAHNMRM